MNEKDKRFIEETFPVKEISEISAKEKNIRHGHISTLHIWWARRPLASSRATSYAALIPLPQMSKDREDKKDFIVRLSKWENSLNLENIQKARKEILQANGGKPPKVLDPFAGGGAIPLEALRLGCEVYAGDYNPVAVLILKCVLEYPQKFGRAGQIEREFKNLQGNKVKEKFRVDNVLLEDVRKWGNWVLEEAKKEIERFYPVDEDGSIPVGYIWARTVPCQNPSCNAEIPLMRQFWLAKKSNKKVALYPYVEGEEVKFKIVGDGYEEMPDDFDPSKGSIKRAIVTCPVCGSVIEAKTLRSLFKEGKNGERLVAVVLHNPKQRGKKYRVATEKDVEIFREAEKYLEKKREEFIDKWGFNPVPDEPLPPKGTLGFRIQGYGMDKWGDLFNARQKLALITFMDKIREAYYKILDELKDRDDIEDKEDYAKAGVTYLALMLGKLEDWNSTLSVWRGDQERNEHVFNRQALPMVWDYGERNPFEGNLMSPKGIDSIIEHLSQIPPPEDNFIPKVTQASATSLPYPDNFFDAVFTDPPYYDNVPYSFLSDFFYVWLKRTIGDLYPDLFSTPLTPKSQEIVAYTDGKSWEEAKRSFEEGLRKAFKEIYRVLKPHGTAVVVYAHKTTEGWEALINSLLDAGFVITASWPIDTEMKARLRAKESAALASSIYFVCRKTAKKETGWFSEVKDEIKKHIYKKLETLWKKGVSGADYLIAAIGSSIEIFGKYKKILDYEGNEIRADKLIEYVREIVTDYAVKQILHNGIASELSPLTRFYILWRWTYGEARVLFDDARKLAQSTGVDLEKVWNRGFIRKEKEFIYVVGPQDRTLEELEDSSEFIDVLHKVLLLWKTNHKDEMLKVLIETGYGDMDVFYKVAQAILEALPDESKEKKLLGGFLSGRSNIVRKIKQPGRLF